LSRTRAAFITISHDRAFLRRLARATLWLDRGVVRRMDRPFDAFEDWRDENLGAGGPRATQARPQDQGRGALGRRGHLGPAQAQPGPGAGAGKLRETRAAMIAREGGAALSLDAGAKGGKRVIEARGISRSFGDRTIIAPLDPARAARGPGGHRGSERGGQDHASQHADRDEAPDTGTVTLGTGLELAVFDQTRAALDPDQTCGRP
jgi:ATP-binding cassette subfamily F protein uup